MKQFAQQILETVTSAKVRLRAIMPETAGAKTAPDAWSKKEILGHLIDSAANNHQRIVRGALNQAADFPPYQQTGWVAVQRYQEANWEELIDLFALNHLHLCRVIASLPPEVLNNPCGVGKDAPVALEFVITDYLRHLRHHLDDLLAPTP